MAKSQKIITLVTTDGKTVSFDASNPIGSGAMKDVYMSQDQTCVVGFFRKEQDTSTKERLEKIVNVYKKQMFDHQGGDQIKNLFCWPSSTVEWEKDGKKLLGVVSPVYASNFYFDKGRFKGKEKEGKWFASAKLRNKHLDDDVKGSWLKYLQICIQISRAVKKLHAAGLAHSDLSYKNVLVDPENGKACIIDIDGLVVPGKFPPDVVGTPDFIAPEVLETVHLKRDDKNKNTPNIQTDRHALAVLIYMYLLYRHPLKGGMICDKNDSANDEELCMGKKALFIEHPTDKRNRPNMSMIKPEELPQADINKLPYTLCGPYLTKLFDRAFIDGLHDPSKRPSASEWESALIKTVDLIQPCQNPDCKAHWFVFDNKKSPKCPFCGSPYKGKLPVINFYYRPREKENFRPENYRLMVFNKQTLYLWHIDRNISPNEKLTDAQKKPVGDFHLFKNNWILINRNIPELYIVKEKGNQKVNIGDSIPLIDGQKILFGKGLNYRLAVIQLVDN